jgi:hypothetical protein
VQLGVGVAQDDLEPIVGRDLDGLHQGAVHRVAHGAAARGVDPLGGVDPDEGHGVLRIEA